MPKLPGGTSHHRAIEVSYYQAPYIFNLGVLFCYGVDFLGHRKYRTRNQGTKPILGKSCTNSLISYRIVLAYKKPIIEALFQQSGYMYTHGIYTHGAWFQKGGGAHLQRACLQVQHTEEVTLYNTTTQRGDEHTRTYLRE